MYLDMCKIDRVSHVEEKGTKLLHNTYSDQKPDVGRMVNENTYLMCPSKAPRR